MNVRQSLVEFTALRFAQTTGQTAQHRVFPVLVVFISSIFSIVPT